MPRYALAIVLALIAGWYLRVLDELDNSLFEPMVSTFGLLVILVLVRWVRREKEKR